MLGRTTLRRAAAAALTAALLALGGSANASAIVPGGLVSANCLTSPALLGCTTVPNLGTSNRVMTSPNGAQVYALTTVSAGVYSLLTFDRNPGTGQLTLKDCIRSSAVSGCRTLPVASNLSAPTAMVIPPDGTSLYVANSGTSTITEFDRDAASGVLSLKAAAPCIANLGGPPPAPCVDARAMSSPQSLAIQGDELYVASSASSGVTALNIGSGGALSQAGDNGVFAGCVQQINTDGCGDGRGLASARELVVTGDRVYVATGGRSIAVLSRDADGRMQMLAPAAACLNVTTADTCTSVPEFVGSGAINDIALGAGGELYVTLTANTNTARVVTFNAVTDGLARRSGQAGCVNNGAATTDCSLGRGLATPTSIVTSADGEDVYVTGGTSGGVVELNRAADGTLTLRNDIRGCVMPSALGGCSTLSTLSTPIGIAIPPDGHHVYVVSSATGRLSTLKRDSSGPVCNAAAVTVQAGSVGALSFPCSDPDGDALAYQTLNPPTLGSLGFLDNGAGTIVYAAPQGQNGATTYTFRATYADPSFGSFPTDGALTINVQGAPPPPGLIGLDADHDGFTAGQDCNDSNAAIRPGAMEIKGNHIDENCDGVAEPFPTLTSGVLHNWDSRSTGRRSR